MASIWLYLILIRMAFAQLADPFLEIARGSLVKPGVQGLSFLFAGNITGSVDDYSLNRRQLTCNSGYGACEYISGG